jgi:hypothetical protein
MGRGPILAFSARGDNSGADGTFPNLVRLLNPVLPISRLPVSVGDGQDSNH